VLHPNRGSLKFDTLLGMHLADPKPTLFVPLPGSRRAKSTDHSSSWLMWKSRTTLRQSTLIIGPVGAGKSTYLKHFELVTGRALLEKQGAHWIYVDFEQMGKAGEPRKFLYQKLRDYLLAVHPSAKTDYKSLVEPAYREVIAGRPAVPCHGCTWTSPSSIVVQPITSSVNTMPLSHMSTDSSATWPRKDYV